MDLYSNNGILKSYRTTFKVQRKKLLLPTYTSVPNQEQRQAIFIQEIRKLTTSTFFPKQLLKIIVQ